MILSILTLTNSISGIVGILVLLITIYSTFIKPICDKRTAPKPDLDVSFRDGKSLLKISPNMLGWCEVYISLNNTGEKVLKEFVIKIEFEPHKIEKLHAGFDPPFYSTDDENYEGEEEDIDGEEDFQSATVERGYIKYKPQGFIPQKDITGFSFLFMPREGVTDIKAEWTFVSDYLKKSGELTIHVNPKYVNIQH